jgi:hypothetical protein
MALALDQVLGTMAAAADPATLIPAPDQAADADRWRFAGRWWQQGTAGPS